MGKKPIVSVSYENERIHRPIEGRFMGFYVNGFKKTHKSARGPHRSRLRVVPHFSSGIVERAKRERA